MKNVNELIDQVREKTKISSDNRLAEKIGIKRQTIHQWRQGTAPIADERIAQLCAIGKLDAPRWIAKIHAERAESPTERAAWKAMLERLTATAATLLIGAGITCPNPSQAHALDKNFSNVNSHNAYYVHVEKVDTRTSQ
ncbi:DUF3693 domain-containing protein [Xylella fastidiosa]|uniref:DUF3693 domain-containing protein n=1 Tax=Xylella fastidiosa TaxID=2371 RepID=UPI000766073D|nr:hypothetical protein ADT30_08865 [Xylella fastidiosa]